MATIADVIATVDKLRPNQYSTDVKIRWLSDCDGTIYSELKTAYEQGNMPETFVGYTAEIDPNTVLLAPAPHDVLYRYYLMAQIDYHNGEMPKYNNSTAQYNAALQAYKNWYNRTYMPSNKAAYYKL
jgi:hypothetical protein